MEKKKRKKQHFAAAVFVMVWTAIAPFFVVLIAEMMSGVKYAPLAAFFQMGAIAAIPALALAFAFARKVARTEDEATATLLMYPAMLLPLIPAAGMHMINIGLVGTEPQQVETVITRRVNQTRKPRDGEAFVVHILELRLDDVRLHGKTLTGDHKVFVDKEIIDARKVGDTFELTMNCGVFGPCYSLDTDGIRSFGR